MELNPKRFSWKLWCTSPIVSQVPFFIGAIVENCHSLTLESELHLVWFVSWPLRLGSISEGNYTPRITGEVREGCMG